MKTLYTLAYPRLSDDDLEWIEKFRRLHDPQAAMVAPHFTLVFGCDEVDERAFIEHVETVSRQAQPIKFTCRYAMLGSGVEPASLAYVYLIPDEGFSALSRLHDALHTGALAGPAPGHPVRAAHYLGGLLGPGGDEAALRRVEHARAARSRRGR